MATKTLTITEDAYKLLADNKLENESFSQEIKRIMVNKGKKSLKDFFGILSHEEGEIMMKDLENIRKKQRILTKKRISELK